MFSSSADNLVPGDTNGARDVFVRDRLEGATQRVSVATDGSEGNLYASGGSISANGRYVAFGSAADNLVTGDANGVFDIFVHDRETGETTRVSVASDGSQADGDSRLPAISGDGRFVAFLSDATSLVPGDTNGRPDVFVHDRQTGATECVSCHVSVAAEMLGPLSATISADGRYVAFVFTSQYIDLPCTGCGVYLYDRQTGETARVPDESWSHPYNFTVYDGVSMSADGRYVVFERTGCLGHLPELWCFSEIDIYDTVSAYGTDLLRTDQGRFFSPVISADGRLVAFSSTVSDLVPADTNGVEDVFLLDRFPDHTPPDTEIISGPCAEPVVCPKDITICWTGTDDQTPAESLQYYWRLDGSDWQGPTSQTCVPLPPLTHDIHFFEVRAMDRAGNLDPSSAECHLSVYDGFPPNVSLTSPLDGSTVEGIVTISATASDPNEVARVEFYARGLLLCTLTRPPYSCAWNTAAVADGPAEMCAKAFDSCGHSAQACITVTVDNTTFDDVPKTSPFWPYVEALAAAGITSGCSANPPLFCPYGNITRAQMAVLFCRAAGKGPLDSETPTFCDVPKTNPYYGWIERIADPDSWNGNPPTIGCAVFPCRRYCPSKSVTRDEIAAFLVRATGKLPMPSCSGVFADVGAYWACPFIERLAYAPSWPGSIAVTAGCALNPRRYCPKSNVTRGQMAVFLVRAFGIPL